MSFRIEKVRKAIKEELSLIFLYKLKDPAFSMLTITDVKVTPDLKIAKVYVSVMDRENREIVLKKLNGAKKMIRTSLASQIKIKFVPELCFYIDDTMDYVEKIENILNEIRKDDKSGNEEQE